MYKRTKELQFSAFQFPFRRLSTWEVLAYSLNVCVPAWSYPPSLPDSVFSYGCVLLIAKNHQATIPYEVIGVIIASNKIISMQFTKACFDN